MLSYCIQELRRRDKEVETSRPPPLTTGVERKATDRANGDNGAPNLVKVLESTEKELFDCKVQLKTKVHVYPN